MTAIIADENIIIRKKLRQILEYKQIEVIAEAENGLHAYNKFVEYHPDIIFLSLHMPIFDGVSALKRIHQYDESVSVIMMCEPGKNRTIFEALELGATHYIEMPLEEHQVFKVLDDVNCLRNGMV